MSLWLKGAIEDRGCEGQGCPTCPYQIYNTEETWACVGDDRWDGHIKARKLWYLMGKPQRAERLGDIIDEMEEDENGVWVMNLRQVRDSIDLIAGLREELYEFTGNKHFRISPDEIDWDMEEYFNLITYWKNPDMPPSFVANS